MLLFGLAKDFVKDILNRTLVIYIFRRELSKMTAIEDYVTFAYNFHHKIIVLPEEMRWLFSIVPFQVKAEITQLLKIVALLKPKTLMEIGTANGGTLFLFSRVAGPDALILSLDLPAGRFGGGYSVWKFPLYRSFATAEQRISLIRANSHNPKTLEKIEGILGRQKLDFLFIDGDHTYEGVMRDFEMYSSLVRKGGIIAFHDIVPGPPKNVGAVPQFWHQICGNYKFLEIVRDWNQGGFGIGVIHV